MDEYIKRSDALAKYQFERIDGEVRSCWLEWLKEEMK